MNIRNYVVSAIEIHQYTQFFESTDLMYSPVWFICQTKYQIHDWSAINQTPSEGLFCYQCCLIPELISLMRWFFLVNRKHTTYNLYGLIFWRADSPKENSELTHCHAIPNQFFSLQQNTKEDIFQNGTTLNETTLTCILWTKNVLHKHSSLFLL